MIKKPLIVIGLVIVTLAILLGTIPWFLPPLETEGTRKYGLETLFLPDFGTLPRDTSPLEKGLAPGNAEGQDGNLQAYEEFYTNNKSFLKSFLAFYKKEIPTILINPPVNFSELGFYDLINLPVPRYSGLRDAARSVGSMAQYFMLKGKYHDSAVISLAVLKFGLDIEHGFGSAQPLLLKMIATSVKKISLKQLVLLFGRGVLTIDQEQKVLGQVKALIQREVPVWKFMEYERDCLRSFNFRKHFSLSAMTASTGKPARPSRSFKDALQVFFFADRAKDKLDAFLDKIYGPILSAGEKIPAVEVEKIYQESSRRVMEICKVIGEFDLFAPAENMAKLMISIAVPNFRRAYSICLEDKAYTEGLRLIHQLNTHRTSTGSYPQSLDQLDRTNNGGPPIDPYTGKNFNYTLSGKSFILSSPGFPPDPADPAGGKNNGIVIYQAGNAL